MTYIKPSTENKVIAHLIHGENNIKDISKYIKKLFNITWSKNNQEIYKLCKDYIKLDKPDFGLSDYIANEHSNREYIIDLIEIIDFSPGILKLNIDKLIKIQETTRVNNALIGLKNKPVNEVLRDVKNLKGVQNVKPMTLADVKKKRLIDRAFEKDAPSTGFPSLDAIIKGFVANHVYTMTGDTNVGKTQACCNFAYNVAKQGKRVLYFSLEPDTTVIEYLASVWSRKRFDGVTEKDLDSPPNIDIDIYTKEHVESLNDMVNIVENSERYDLIIIDHFGYFTSSSNNKTQTESNAMKTMASFSKRNNTAVLIVVHPRKSAVSASKERKLSIQDISGSAAFSQDATDVLIIVRKKDEDDPLKIKYINEGYIAVHKTKAGGNGAAAIKFIEGSALIMELDAYANKVVEILS